MLYIVEEPREIEVTLGKGVRGTIAIPHSVDSKSQFEEGYAPSSNKIALLFHGQGGHRNYCYQKPLAHKLAAHLGIYSLRIDFRGCGDSADSADESKGRLLDQDVADIQACAEYVIDGTKNPLGINFTLSSIISHSRGSVAAFTWALEQDRVLKLGGLNGSKAILVPNLVNCSSRYRSQTILGRYKLTDPETRSEMNNVYLSSYRHGKWQLQHIPFEEIASLSTPDFQPLSQLPTSWSVLSVYGLQDTIIPVDDFSYFANVLNRGPKSHTLKLIKHGDHNFYGTVEIAADDSSTMEELNELDLPMNSRNMVNYNYEVVDIIVDYLSPAKELDRFVLSSLQVGELPRWKNVEGVSNFRDAGGWHLSLPTFSISESKQQYYVKPNTIYRCANMTNITTSGLQELSSLGVKIIFDLRSDGECTNDGIIENLESYGMKRVHAPVFKKDDYSPQSIAVRYANLMTSWYTYVNVYEDILDNGIEAFKAIFDYIRDDGAPFVFHCTAGKDRTGMVSMLILLLAGLDKHSIGKEYELTTIGLKKDHPKLRLKFAATLAKLKLKMSNGTADIQSAIGQGRKNFDLEQEGFSNLISSRYEAMLATIELFNEKYGGILDYLKNQLGYSEDDILKIYKNLVTLGEEFKTSSSICFEHGSLPMSKF